MVLFNWDCSNLMNNIFLIRSLDLFASVSLARISKCSKSIKQLHSSRWSDTTDCLTLLRCFHVKLEIPIWSAAPVKKMVCFIIISNIAVTARVSVKMLGGIIFLRESL